MDNDLLFREVHHRMRNHMTNLSALFTIRAEGLTDPEARTALTEASKLVESMAVVYDTLYTSPPWDEIITLPFLPTLITEVLRTFPAMPGLLVGGRIEEFSLPAKVVQPLAILVTELVANSRKYAFQGRKAGNLDVSLRCSGTQATLEVEDDGKHSAPSPRPSHGFGTELLASLTKQLHGTLRYDRSQGTRATLEFSLG